MIALLCCTTVASLYAGYRITYLQESNRIGESSSAIVRDVERAASDATAALGTLSALHIEGLSDPKKFSRKYAKQFIQEIPSIAAMGRFKNEMGDWYPVSAVESDDDFLRAIVGLDFGKYESISSVLPDAVATNRMAAALAPVDWGDDIDLVLLKPAFDDDALLEPPDRSEGYFIGGFWSTFSFDSIMTGLYADAETAQASMSVDITYTQTAPSYDSMSDGLTVHSEHFPIDEKTWLGVLFEPIETTKRILLGNGVLQVKVTGQPAFSKVAIVVGVLLTLFLLSLYLLCLGVVYSRRRSGQEKLNALRAVTRERAKAERTLNSITESVVALDNNLKVTYINEACIKALGVDSASVIGEPIHKFTNLYDIENTGALFDLTAELSNLGIGEGAQRDVLVYDQNHVARSMQLTMANSTEHQYETERYTLVLRDVSAERALTRELEYQANHDSLTGVWNRFYFEKRLKSLVDSARRSRVNHALVYMDLDQFKIVNDTCGHTAGDRLLCELTTNLEAVLRPGDVLARLGGDEFGLLVINASYEDAVQVAERVYGFFQNAVFYHEGKAFPVRSSIGFVPINDLSGNIEDVMAAADMACYSAKDSGRNSLNVYSEDNVNIAQRHLEMNWLPRLQAALKDDHFQLLVQAVADTQSRDITHYEFLLRLCRPDGSVVTPMQFIQAAERYDLMKDIDRWVIKAAINEIARNHKALGGKCSYSINLSGQSAADETLLPFIEECLEHSGVPASCIWFEITETAAITHFQVAVELFQKLRAMGSKVALDDFGSGLSSFGYLKNLPVDVIKIDGQFVKNLEHDHIDREMVRAIHRVAQTMGICSVAEFVESENSLTQLAEIGVDLAQGYHIAQPCSLADAIDHYQSQESNDKHEPDPGLSSAA